MYRSISLKSKCYTVMIKRSLNSSEQRFVSVVFIVVYSDRACGTAALGEFDSDQMSVLVHTYCAGLRVHVVIYIVLFSTKDQPESCKVCQLRLPFADSGLCTRLCVG